jgi:Sigma-70 factor, region 1.1
VTTAVCVSCGARKTGVFTECSECDYLPETEREVIYSLACSDRHRDVADLDQISRDIADGARVRLSREEEDLLRPAAQAHLEQVGYLSIAKAEAKKKSVAWVARPDARPMLEWKAEPPKPSSLLDLSDASVQRLIRLGKSRGYVTYNELNDVLPSWEVSADEIEATITMLSDMGIDLLKNEPKTKDSSVKERNGSLPTLAASNVHTEPEVKRTSTLSAGPASAAKDYVSAPPHYSTESRPTL